MSVIRRYQTIDVTELNHRADLLVLGNGIATEILLFLSHVLWLDLHSETAAHRHVYTILE